MNYMRKETDVAQKSLECYCRNVRTVGEMMGVPRAEFYKNKNLDFLSDPEKVNKELMESGKSQNTLITYLASIVKALECHETKADEYKKLMGMLMVKRKEEDEKHEKTQKQENNWTTMSDLREVLKKLEGKCRAHDRAKRRGDPDVFQDYQDHLIAFLYVGDNDHHAPLRLDYCPMRVINEKGATPPPTMNYLLCHSRNKKEFVFNQYKTAKAYGAKTVPLSKKMNAVVNRFLDVKKKLGKEDTDLLLNSKWKPMNDNTLCKYITRIFKPTGKNITVNLIRHFYISEKHPVEVLEAQKTDASAMCHSVETQAKYAKK